MSDVIGGYPAGGIVNTDRPMTTNFPKRSEASHSQEYRDAIASLIDATKAWVLATKERDEARAKFAALQAKQTREATK